MSTTVLSSPTLEYHEIFQIKGEYIKMKENNSQSGHMRIDSSSSDTYSESIVDHCMINNDHAPLQRSYTNLVNLIEQHRKLDRSISEPTSRYKTELCRPFEENGSCKYGDKCQFAHGYNELRNLTRHPKYKTELCRTFHKIGFCPYGPRCHFVHNFEEARIHNSKAGLRSSSQHQQQHIVRPQPSFIANFGSLLQSPLNVNVNLLEQLVATPQVAAAVAAAAAAAAAAASVTNVAVPLTRTNSLALTSSRYETNQQQQRMHRSASVGMPVLIPSRPKPLDLSSALSLGSTADSISPTSSLSQSPTNSMASFFNEESGSIGALPTTYVFNKESNSIETGTAFNSARQSQSPFQTLREELDQRTPSPLSPGAESRLPVFNRISGTLLDFEDLRI